MYLSVGKFKPNNYLNYENTKYGKMLSVHSSGLNNVTEETINRDDTWDDYMLMYITNGSANVEIDGTKFLAKVGDIVILPPNKKYEVKSNYFCEWFWVHFNINLPFSDFDIPTDYKFTIGPSLELESAIRELILENGNIDYNAHEICTMKFMGILFLIGRCYKRTKKDIRFNDAIDYVLYTIRKLGSPVTGTVKEFAGLAGCSELTFRQECKKRTGLTPKQYAINCKVINTKKFLESGEPAISLQKYAASSGFSQYSNFSKFVKKHLGMSPENYIKTFRNSRYKRTITKD